MMPYIAQYLLKLSISLGVVYLFYALVLRRLTFYTWNRWYLLGYSALALFIPFVDISPILEKKALTGNMVVQMIPVIGYYNVGSKENAVSGWMLALLLLLTGILFMLGKLLVQYISFLQIRRTAQLLSDDEVKIYQVNKNIIPFSFGRSIFINQHQHSEEELKKIVRHEFIHVKQRHTADILWGEVLCMLNWYNPFAWFIRHAIRQNLEFIADQQVLQSGFDRKQYQYLLLKVVGVPAFSITNQFNVSSLKKRIAMMNKIRSAKVHLVKFMFVLPLASVLLLAFRQAVHHNQIILTVQQPAERAMVTAPVPEPVLPVVAATGIDTVPYKVIILKKTKTDSARSISDVIDIRYGSIRDTSLFPGAQDSSRYFINCATCPSKNGQQPLIVVDGILITDEMMPQTVLGRIDPNDIESISILKDASAESLYGLRGKSGVILVSTKKGVKLPPAVAQPPIGITLNRLDSAVSVKNVLRIKVDTGKPGAGLEFFPGLIIVDGKEYDSLSIRNIELKPDNIHHVEVLKGNSATSIYGSKGEHGVIIITSKKSDKPITGTGFHTTTVAYTSSPNKN